MMEKIQQAFEALTSAEWTKETLDRISIFWQTYETYVAVAVGLEKATLLPGIPEGDRRLAKVYLEDYVNALQPVIDSLHNFVKTPVEERKWTETCKPIEDAIEEFENADCGEYEESITVLLEAIYNNRKSWKDEAALRRKIGQHTIVEVWETINYYRLIQEAEYLDDEEEEDQPKPDAEEAEAHTDTLPDWLQDVGPVTPNEGDASETESDDELLPLGDTTIDIPAIEKNEFEAAIHGKIWTEKTKKDNRLAILRLKRAMDDEEFTENVKIIWATVMGKSKIVELADETTRKSTLIDAVIAAEDILQALKDSGIADWEPDDEEDVEDDLEPE